MEMGHITVTNFKNVMNLSFQLAVSHGFGGADSEAKAEWMVFAIDQWFAENGDFLILVSF